MTSRDKLRALVLMWMMAFFISLTLFVGKDMINLGEAVLGFLLFAGLIGGTIAISTSPAAPETVQQRDRSIQESAKLKREDTQLIDRLVESMDEDERAALMRRLSIPDDYSLSDDGELRKR